MTNPESRINDECPNDEAEMGLRSFVILAFDIRALIRHSGFVIRQCGTQLLAGFSFKILSNVSDLLAP
jgi:hypothetical protein